MHASARLVSCDSRRDLPYLFNLGGQQLERYIHFGVSSRKEHTQLPRLHSTMQIIASLVVLDLELAGNGGPRRRHIFLGRRGALLVALDEIQKPHDCVPKNKNGSTRCCLRSLVNEVGLEEWVLVSPNNGREQTVRKVGTPPKKCCTISETTSLGFLEGGRKARPLLIRFLAKNYKHFVYREVLSCFSLLLLGTGRGPVQQASGPPGLGLRLSQKGDPLEIACYPSTCSRSCAERRNLDLMNLLTFFSALACMGGMG